MKKNSVFKSEDSFKSGFPPLLWQCFRHQVFSIQVLVKTMARFDSREPFMESPFIGILCICKHALAPRRDLNLAAGFTSVGIVM